MRIELLMQVDELQIVSKRGNHAFSNVVPFRRRISTWLEEAVRGICSSIRTLETGRPPARLH
jgi:hypothetical protein